MSRPYILRVFAIAAMASLCLRAQPPKQQPARESFPEQSFRVQMPFSTGEELPGDTQPVHAQNANAPAVPVPSTADSPEIANPRLRPVPAELVSRLDTKSAKTGDSVIARTTKKAIIANGLEIPQGSRIVGHVTAVEPAGNGTDNSRLAIEFDQAEIRGGGKLPIDSVIESVAPVGGATNVASPQAPASISANHEGPRAPGAENATSSHSNPNPVGTIVARNGNVAIRTTAIPGVLLAANLNGQPFANASGALLGARSDLRLEGGTRMILAVAAARPEGNTR